MAAEHVSWLLPAAKTAYKHREEIAGAWEKVMAWMRGNNYKIAFTGCPGVGKTVLLDHLAGGGAKPGYRPPEESQKEEKGALTQNKKRLRMVTVPGQKSGPRYEAINRMMSDVETVDGIVHVVAYGFATVRNQTAREMLVQDHGIKTIEDYRKAQNNVELEDLRQTCELIRRSHQRHHRPSWLLVAVAKVDLYQNELDAARVEYSPLGQSEFSRTLNDLRKDVGGDFFRWDAVPVCAQLEDFTWNDQTVKCGLLPDGRDHYLAGFAHKLQNFC